ncbi:MAG TPA: MFS transporter [Bacteroidales bacterium]
MVRKIWNKDFILLMSSNFLMCVTYYSIISTLPIYLVSELRAGESEVGLVLAAYTIASVMVRPFGGFSLDKFGRRTVFLLSLLFYTIFFCGYLVATSISLLVLLRFVQGITWGVTTIAGSTIAVDIIPPEKRGEGIGYFGMSTTLGMSIGPVMGLFVYHHFGYMTVFVACIAVSIISLVCAGVIRLPQRNLSENLQLTLGNLFDRKAVVPSLNLLIIMSTYGGLMSFIALYGREIGVQNTSLFFLIFSIGIITSRFSAGKSFDRNGPLRILTICLSLLIIGFPLLVIFNNAAGFYTSALIIGFGIGVVFPVFQAIVNNLADPSRRGAANSTLYTALDIGMGAGMVMMGYVSQYISISATFLVSTVIIAAGLLVFRKFTAPYYKKQTAS